MPTFLSTYEELLKFKQSLAETLRKARDRFKMILWKMLGGGVDLAIQLQHFYGGLGGSVLTKPTREIIVLVEKENNLRDELVELSDKELVDDNSNTSDLGDMMEEEATRNYLEQIYQIDLPRTVQGTIEHIWFFLEQDEEGKQPVVNAQWQLNPAAKEIVKKCCGSVSPTQCTPKEGGPTEVTNEKNELVPTRMIDEKRVLLLLGWIFRIPPNSNTPRRIGEDYLHLSFCKICLPQVAVWTMQHSSCAPF
ncbi:RNA-directed DNA polymerase-like protein [Gossypium australe]|uniref:RNA-directed DNA polymerase-like protein n=1 Tax=Gossypium australe TaxID=47621 RepID=A0A5B6WFX4_9ROSI|nr:RNA-directed DNA polymerase-like protein [Gossypium australe]